VVREPQAAQRWIPLGLIIEDPHRTRKRMSPLRVPLEAPGRSSSVYAQHLAWQLRPTRQRWDRHLLARIGKH